MYGCQDVDVGIREECSKVLISRQLKTTADSVLEKECV